LRSAGGSSIFFTHYSRLDKRGRKKGKKKKKKEKDDRGVIYSNIPSTIVYGETIASSISRGGKKGGGKRGKKGGGEKEEMTNSRPKLGFGVTRTKKKKKKKRGEEGKKRGSRFPFFDPTVTKKKKKTFPESRGKKGEGKLERKSINSLYFPVRRKKRREEEKKNFNLPHASPSAGKKKGKRGREGKRGRGTVSWPLSRGRKKKTLP